MNPELIDKVRAALEGWLRDDTGPLEKLLHPDVELVWWKPGEWDISGKKQILTLLNQRAAQRPYVSIDVAEAGEGALIVTRVAPAREGVLPATLITFKDGLIVKMHQFRSAEEALRAAPFRTRA